jgi:hypothetical protein
MALRGHTSAAGPVEPTIRCLITTCGPCMLGFPAEWIRGILTQEEAGSGQTVSSAGATYPRTSLADRLRLSPRADSADARIVLYGNGSCSRALIVDTVVELIDVDRRDLRPMPVHFRGAERTKFHGLLVYGSSVVLMLNPVWLLETDNRMDALESRTMLLQDEAQPSLHDPGVVILDRELSVEHMKQEAERATVTTSRLGG